MRRTAFAGFLLFVATSAAATTQDEVRAALGAKFTTTERSKLTGRITKPGTVLVIQRAGIRADPETKMMLKPVIIKNGAIEGVGGGSLVGGESGRALKRGDHVYVYDVRTSNEYVMLIYGTTDSYDVNVNGSTRAQSYKGAISFRYDDGLKTVDTAKVVHDVSTWMATEAESASSSANTVTLGQTPEDVIAILGSPEKKIDLGAKKIFVYKDMKIVFIDGKVSDVQ